MPTPRSEFSSARLVTAATVVLACGLILLSGLVLLSDFQQRRDARALADASSSQALDGALERFEEELANSLRAAEVAGQDIAASLSEAADNDQATDEDGLPSVAALAGAVIDAEVARAIPAVEQVIFTVDSAGGLPEVVGVDRFGSRNISPATIGFNSSVAFERSVMEPFSGQGSDFSEDGIASYYPVGENAEDGWVVLILSGERLAVGSDYERLAAPNQIQSGVDDNGSSATLRASIPYTGGDFVAARTIEIADGEPPAWWPFILLSIGAATALAGVLSLGHFVRKNHMRASERMQNAEATPYGSSTEFEQNIVGVVELDEMGMIVGVNQAYCDQVRRERDDLLGTSLLALTEPADRTRHLAALDKLMTGDARTAQVEHRHKTSPSGATPPGSSQSKHYMTNSPVWPTGRCSCTGCGPHLAPTRTRRANRPLWVSCSSTSTASRW